MCPEKAIAAAISLSSPLLSSASAQNCPALRKINIGVAVAPPNVVHTAPYVAKALGLFAKHCIDATIIQFDGGAAGTSVTAVAQGSAISNLPDVAIARGLKGKQIWGLAPRPPQGYVVPAEVKTAADLKGKRLSAAGGVGGFNWLMGARCCARPASARTTRSSFRRAPPAACPASSPARSKACCCIPRTCSWCSRRSQARTC